jgi:hypothetical protein
VKEKVKSRSSLDWIQTLQEYQWENNFPGYIKANYGTNGELVSANIYVTLKPGEYVEIKKK